MRLGSTLAAPTALLVAACGAAHPRAGLGSDAATLECLAVHDGMEGVEASDLGCPAESVCYRLTLRSGSTLEAECWGDSDARWCSERLSHPIPIQRGEDGCRMGEPGEPTYRRG